MLKVWLGLDFSQVNSAVNPVLWEKTQGDFSYTVSTVNSPSKAFFSEFIISLVIQIP